MTIDSAVMAFAGAMILLSLVLAIVFSPYWLLLTAFIGVALFQAAFTGFAPPAILFKKLGLKAGRAFYKD
ncbi:MAG TPA: DUF2892 domain-containing protein [Rhodospirillaceae bacterium]|nr:DUF2892 domain-containing protein [Rhodospirillaceae bacterium]